MSGPDRRGTDGSRVEAAEAGVHAEIEEAAAGQEPEEHVTATDVATQPEAAGAQPEAAGAQPEAAGAQPEAAGVQPGQRPAAVHHHHPLDPNAGVVRGTVQRGALLAAVLAGAVTIAAVVLLALAVQGAG